jgi:excisionase family DNA binding protein
MLSAMTEEKRLFTVNEACVYLSVSRMSLYRMIQHKEIAPVSIGGRTLFDRKDLDELIEKAKGPTGRRSPNPKASK